LTSRRWTKCACPWHFGYQFEQREFRFSLHKYACKPHDYVMGRGEAEEYQRQAVNQIHTGEIDSKGRPIVTAGAPGLIAAAAIQLYVVDQIRIPSRSAEGRQKIERQLALICAVVVDPDTGLTFGNKPLADIVKADVEAIRAARRAACHAVLEARKQIAAMRDAGIEPPVELLALGRSKRNLRDGEVAIDRLFARLRHFFNWAVAEGHLGTTPFRRGTTVVIKQTAAGEKRNRRLGPDEEQRLLAVAAPHLRRLIIGAVETCARQGELLALQWGDVSVERGELTIRAVLEGARKTRKSRILPISPRLHALLTAMRRDPSGRDHPAGDFVFGDECGGQVGPPKTAWETAVLRAHGYAVLRDSKTKALLPESRATLQRIDLHWHDLRHEGGSRLLEAGWPLTSIQAVLGHATLAQTATYLNATKTGPADSMRRFGSGEVTLTAILPPTGTPGTVVTLIGTSFQPGMTVDFGGVAGLAVTVINPNTAQAVIPLAATLGTVTVTAKTGTGLATLQSGFAYVSAVAGRTNVAHAADAHITPHVNDTVQTTDSIGFKVEPTTGLEPVTC
jgi:integrase